jgi:two-component system, chemotaxis family, chemotaxis protein CheY
MTENGTIIIDLPAALDADSATALVEQLKALPRSATVRLNAAAVTSVSLRYVQVLLSAFKTFGGVGIADATPELAGVFAGYGLAYPEASGTTDIPAVADPMPPDGAAEMPLDEPAATAFVDEPVSPPAVDAEPAQVAEDLTASAPTADRLPANDLPTNDLPTNALAASDLPANDLPDEPAAAAQSDNPQTQGPVMPKTILTIDDSRTMRDMLKMALGSAGFTVVQAVDGEDGLNVLAQQPVDLIITDINMPKLDGFGVIRAVRSNPAHNDTPILVLSTEGEQESKDIAKDAGATGWIVKPFDPDGLVNIVNQVCG